MLEKNVALRIFAVNRLRRKKKTIFYIPKLCPYHKLYNVAGAEVDVIINGV